jgi:hypothetical protein
MAFLGTTTVRSLTITNTGSTTLRWFASPTFSWMRLSLDYGNLAPGASVTISVSVSSAGLAPRLYAGVINISAGTARTSVTVQYLPKFAKTSLKAAEEPVQQDRWVLFRREDLVFG